MSAVAHCLSVNNNFQISTLFFPKFFLLKYVRCVVWACWLPWRCGRSLDKDEKCSWILSVSDDIFSCVKLAACVRDSDWSIVDWVWASRMLSLTRQECVSTWYIFMGLMRWARRTSSTISLSLHRLPLNGSMTLHVCTVGVSLTWCCVHERVGDYSAVKSRIMCVMCRLTLCQNVKVIL